MNIALLGNKITSLDTFATWETARAEQQRAFNAVPFEINYDDPQQLTQQLGYLAAEEAQRGARQSLMQEIASQDDTFLPVAYRLGALAAFEATNVAPDTKYISHGVSIRPARFRDNRHEQQLEPSSNPLRLATQVGDELERIRTLLDTKESVPVVMVWNHHYFNSSRMDYDEVVVGELTHPREAFAMEAPVVSEAGDKKVVEYTIPSRLRGVEKRQTIRKAEYVQPQDKYKNPAITTLVRLGVAKSNPVSDDPDALYIGKDEVQERVAQAEKDNANFARELERRRAAVIRRGGPRYQR